MIFTNLFVIYLKKKTDIKMQPTLAQSGFVQRGFD